MNKQTKLVLSILGIAALVIPAILLVIQTNKQVDMPPQTGGSRTIDAGKIEQTIDKFELQQQRRKTPPPPSPSPTPEATGSAVPPAQINPEGVPLPGL